MLITTPPEAADAAPSPRPRSVRGIFTRYTIGSVLAAVASEAALLLTYGPGLLSPAGASVAGWAAGALLNYALNRWWAWGKRGRASLRREVLPYWAIAVLSMLLSAWATGVAAGLGERWFDTEGLRLAFVGAVFLGVYGLMFVVKFVLFHYLVFAGEPDATGSGRSLRRLRSRHQVPSTTRE